MAKAPKHAAIIRHDADTGTFSVAKLEDGKIAYAVMAPTPSAALKCAIDLAHGVAKNVRIRHAVRDALLTGTNHAQALVSLVTVANDPLYF